MSFLLYPFFPLPFHFFFLLHIPFLLNFFLLDFILALYAFLNLPFHFLYPFFTSLSFFFQFHSFSFLYFPLFSSSLSFPNIHSAFPFSLFISLHFLSIFCSYPYFAFNFFPSITIPSFLSFSVFLSDLTMIFHPHFLYFKTYTSQSKHCSYFRRPVCPFLLPLTLALRYSMSCRCISVHLRHQSCSFSLLSRLSNFFVLFCLFLYPDVIYLILLFLVICLCLSVYLCLSLHVFVDS